ncbi:MAG: hypothetical protein QOG10_6868 [Kribbellaceae bacterium]|jgi:hypothetical protein|nr:hypothetical protein [Kribbellaceae bacterium]
MFRARNRLLAAAIACAEYGIAVRPAPALLRAPARLDAFGRWICGCGDLLCAEPGEHPAGPAWSTDVNEVAATWGLAAAPNLLISSGNQVALWRLPRVTGAYGMRLFEQERPGPWPPLMKLPDGDWIVATAPAVDKLELATGVVYTEPGVAVLAPPSRRPTGRTRWLQSPAFPQTPLPSAESVLALVARAEQERFELLTGVR